FRERLIELTLLVSVLAAATLVPIIVFGRYFVIHWVGVNHYAGDMVNTIAAVNAFMLAIFSLWGWAINGVGEIRHLMPAMVAQAAINFGLSLFLTVEIGLVGPLLGTTFAFLAVSIWYIPAVLNRLFELKPRRLYYS